MMQLDHLHQDQCGRNQMFSLGADRLHMTAHKQLKETETGIIVPFDTVTISVVPNNFVCTAYLIMCWLHLCRQPILYSGWLNHTAVLNIPYTCSLHTAESG